MNEIIERLGGIGVGTALVTAGYYVWIVGGYLSPTFMVLQWVMTISGALIILKALASDHFIANRAFEGRPGLAVGISGFAISAAITAIQGWSQPGYLLVEAFLFSLSAFIIINSIGREPTFEREDYVKIAGIFGFSATAFIFAYYSLPYSFTAFLAFAIIGVAGAAFIAMRNSRAILALPPLLISMMALFSVLLAQSIPAIATDELALDAYAAHLLLSGINPYISTAMGGAFSYFHLSQFYETPLASGGYVSWLSYPALSFLVMVPAVALGVQARAVLIAFAVALMIAVYLKYRGLGWLSLIPLLIALVDVNLIYYPVGSVPDVVWALLLGVSLATMKKTKLSGALYGLSVAAKQIPLIILPYLIYMLFRDKGKRGTLAYIGAALVSFLAVNVPFIALSPGAWFSSMLAPETDSLIGIGQGAGMVSFLGYYQLSGRYFTLMEAFFAVALLALYVKEYPRYRMSFIAFPILIFFFNYRFLFNYVIYWPVIALLVVPDLKSSVTKARGWFNRNEGLVAIAMLAVPLVTAPAFHVQSSGRISSVYGFGNPLELPGYVTEMRVNLTGMQGANFRIFTAGSMTSVNGLLWNVVNKTEGKGWTVYTIEPLVPEESLPQGVKFEVEAYMGNEQAFYGSGPVYISSPLIENPGLLETLSGIPGWAFVPNTQGGSAHFLSITGGVKLNAEKVRAGWAAAQLEQAINLTALSGHTVSYSIISGYYSNVTTSGNPDIAIGVQVDSGNYEVWYLYSNVNGTYRPNPHTLIILTTSELINFSQASAALQSLGWKRTQQGTLMLIAGSQYTDGNFTAEFSLS
ncbi:MAG: hypothetical protein JRN01_05055 [Nitrososphaerota archaeon]|jgi:uncharacterized membrane protein|nr:hypothetical protein [Nitrososphaerota archaeon]